MSRRRGSGRGGSPLRETARGTGTKAPAWPGLVTVVLLALGIWLRVALPPVRTRTPDEQAYTTFAAGFLDQGYGRYPEVVKGFLADPDLAEIPSPLRAGYFVLLSGAMRLTGDQSSATGSLLSLCSSIATLLLVAWAGWRFLPLPAVPMAVLFLATSPLDLAVARRAWQDGVFGLASFGMFALVLAHARRPRLRTILTFFALGFVALLIKESAVLVLALGAAALAWVEWKERGPRGAAAVAAGTVLVVAVALAVLAGLCGGIAPLLRLLEVTARGRAASEYVRRYQTGSPMYYVTGLGILQPLPWALAALTAIVALVRPAWRRAMERSEAAVVSPIAVLAAIGLAFTAVLAASDLKGLRLLTPIFAPAALLAAAGLQSALAAARLRGTWFRVLCGAAIVVMLFAAFGDLRRFFDLFVRRGIPDLATPWFTARP